MSLPLLKQHGFTHGSTHVGEDILLPALHSFSETYVKCIVKE
jgi:hypothetical protein